MTAMLVGTIAYVSPTIDETTQEETVREKHTLKLEDISLISTNRNNNNSQQALSIPWLNPPSSSNKYPLRCYFEKKSDNLESNEWNQK